MEIDLTNITLAGLAIIGAVNALVIFRPETTPKEKFIVSVAVALLIGYIPADLGVELHNRLVEAIKAAFAASGAYKMSQKIGGK